MLSSQSLPCVKASAAALFRSAPAFGGSGAEMRWILPKAKDGGIVPRTMLAKRAPVLRLLLVSVTAARGGTFGPPKSTQKPARGAAPCPRHPEPDAATPDCSITEHCCVLGSGAKRGGPQAPFFCHPERPKGLASRRSVDFGSFDLLYGAFG